ncbi:lateral signaling target protein 2 homolog isoform X2 [Aethina tumida]|nr:lateral signaling target protein 2 homolog isoform X2 [Aethina tumida]
MDVLIGDERANRDFRAKFPEDVLQENLAGQLWFGAECLAAGSSIMNREHESTAMRPLAKAVTKSLDNVRNLLRDSCLRNNQPNGPLKLDSNELVTEMLLESLKIFDRLFAEFELAYVSAMVPVKSTQEHELQEMICVLFSETLQRALKMKLLTQDMVDDCDPALMFTIPRLAIVSGLLIFPNGPLCIDKSMDEMSEMFRPFQTLLRKIRELLWVLNKRELYTLEKLLCDNEQISGASAVVDMNVESELDSFVDQFYPMIRDFRLQQIVNGTKKGPDSTKKSIKHAKRKEEPQPSPPPSVTTSGSSAPSTSGYLITNTITHNAMVAAASMYRNATPRDGSGVDPSSPPERDSMEVISEAAATLSSILSTREHSTGTEAGDKPRRERPYKHHDLDSPNDSGICTDTTSLDRSPSLDLAETALREMTCSCAGNSSSLPCNCQQAARKTPAQTIPNKKKLVSRPAVKSSPSTTLLTRKKSTKRIQQDRTPDEDSSASGASSDTSSYNSVCNDDAEIALALQAAEIACNNETRAKYKSTEDLIHRLFVCIAGVADQLQTNFACDLRIILKCVFLMNASPDTNEPAKSLDKGTLENSIEYHPSEDEVIENNEFSVDPDILAQEALFDTNVYFHLDPQSYNGSNYHNHPRRSSNDEHSSTLYASLREDVANLHAESAVNEEPQDQIHQNETPPIWIPDMEAPKCMSCGANFTVVRRRHHCRNCGKVFCARCSSNSVPLPKFGHVKPVRVCNKCFIYNLTPFTMSN